MNITNILRKNIGTIVAVFGSILLCIMTFGNLGEIASKAYWNNVSNNLTSIGFMSLGLTLVQVSIKQGLAEQALQRGLNTERTAQKYEEHRAIIKGCTERMLYLPYFLQIYNKRHTQLRKQEFLVNNGYTTENSLLKSHNKRLISRYRKILTHITASDIKWSTVEVLYNKFGRIITLEEYRAKRIRTAIWVSFVCMIGLTFLTGGLFFAPATEPFWQKVVKLFTYIISIAMGVIFSVVKEYEKGAFGVPNELDEINQIWLEFQTWQVPEWIINDIKQLNEEAEHREENTNKRANLSEKQEESETI